MKKLDQDIEKNTTEIGHPIMDLESHPQPRGLLKISEDCVDILEAILNHHRGQSLQIDVVNRPEQGKAYRV
jgi:hypothetical protein